MKATKMMATVDLQHFQQWYIPLQKHVTAMELLLMQCTVKPLMRAGELTRPNVHDVFDSTNMYFPMHPHIHVPVINYVSQTSDIVV
jgi:hypothetical protein